MIPSKSYATSGAFRNALEDRLRRMAEVEQVDLNRRRRQGSFARLLARLFQSKAARWAVKGGYALELRLKFDLSFSWMADAPPSEATL